MTDSNPGRSIRVLHVASSYPLTEGDPTAPFMGEMLAALARARHEVIALVPRVSGLEEGLRDGVEVVGVPYAPPPLQVWGYGRSLTDDGRLRIAAILTTPLALGAMARSVRRAIKQYQPDVVHLHWVLPLGVLATVVPGDTPVVISAHGADARFARGQLRPLARAAVGRADAVIAASAGIISAMTRVHPSVARKSHVIPHGANAALFRPRSPAVARRKLGIGTHNPVVIGVGRLVPKKGFDSLIAAMTHMGMHDNAQLYLIGDGPDKARLQSLVPLEVADRIHFVGARNREQVADWYSASDVVVIPGQPVGGDMDSGPVVLVEALAAGRPVVVTKIGMAPDLIRTGENGVLLDRVEPPTLAAAIQTAVANTDSMGKEARATFDVLGSWDRAAEDLAAIYAQVISERSRLQ